MLRTQSPWATFINEGLCKNVSSHWWFFIQFKVMGTRVTVTTRQQAQRGSKRSRFINSLEQNNSVNLNSFLCILLLCLQNPVV